MKRSIKNLLVLVVLLTTICTVGKVNAASISMTLTSDSKLVAGDTVTVTLRILNIDAGDGVDTISGKLVYDTDVFEEITEEQYTNNFQGLNSWNPMGYNASEFKFTALRGSKVNMASDVLQIKLKAKSAITVNSTSIEVKDMELSGGMETGDIKPLDVKIEINKASQIIPTPDDKVNEQQGGQQNQELPINTQKVNNQTSVINGNNTSNTKLPQTGDEYGIVLAIALVAVISIIAYIRYRNVNIK